MTRTRPAWIPALVLFMLSVAVALALALHQRSANESFARERFAGLAERTAASLQRRMQTYEYEVRGARGAVIAAGGEISRERFRDYSRSRDTAKEFPGSMGFGFIRRVKAADESRFVAEAQRDGFPDFSVRQFALHDGERFVIQYVEPASGNEAAIGVDLASEARRREAAVRSMRTGEATLTAPIELVQLPDRHRTGFLLMLPLYRTGSAVSSEEEREAATIGWAYAPLALSRVLLGFDLQQSAFEMHLLDVSDAARPISMFGTPREPGRASVPYMAIPARVFSREWRIELTASPNFIAQLNLPSPVLVGARFSILGALLAAVLYVYLWSLQRRLGISAERDRLASIVESSDDAIIAEDLAGTVTSWNAGATRTFGFPAVEIVGQPIARIYPDAEFQQAERVRERVLRGDVCQLVNVMRVRKDGTVVYVTSTKSPIRGPNGVIVGISTIARDTTLRMQAEAALQASERHFRDLAESLPHMVWTCAGDGPCDYLSPQWVAYTGVPEGVQLGFGWLEQLHPDDVARTKQHWAQTAATGGTFDIEFRVRRHDGAYRWFKTRAKPIRDQEGRITRWFGSNTDIQDLLDAQEGMQELARELEARVAARTVRLQLATSAARMGVWDWNVADNVLIWDETMRDLYETAERGFSGVYDAWRDALHPADRDDAERMLRDAAAGRGEFNTSFRIVRPNGEIRYLRAAATVERDPTTGEAIRMVGVNWDTTQQRTAELALQSSEALQRAILTNAGTAIIAADAAGTISLFNPAAEELLGYRADELVHRLTPTLFHVPSEVEEHQKRLERELGVAIESPFEVFVAKSRLGKADANEWTYVRKDGSRVPVLLTVSTLRNDAGEVSGYLGLAVDLSLQKQHQQELEALNRLLAERSAQAESANNAKSMFLANMSHEIRTPIGAITGVTYLLARSTMTEDQRGMVQTIERSSRALLGMINEVLDLSKIEAGQLTLDSAPFKLGSVLDDVAGLMMGYAAEKHLELIVDAEPDLPEMLVGDRVRLTQILTNLAGNAIKFTEHGMARLHVLRAQATDARAWVRFDMYDSGPGVPDAVLPKLFTAFKQGEGANVRRVGGTGLGLAIVKQLAGLMGGSVGVASTVGVGSRFWCTIPFDAQATDEVQEPRRVLRVLLVEDHDAQRTALSAAARRLDWDATAVNSGARALELIRTRSSTGLPFDAVVIDWKMPGLDGLQTLSAIRALHEVASESPGVVLTTSYEMAALREQPESAQADVLLGKPITSSALFDAVSRAITQRRTPGRVPDTHARPPSTTDPRRLIGAHVLVVDDNDINREVARRILEREGARVTTAIDAKQAVAQVRAKIERYDLVLMDIQMAEMDGVEATQCIRDDPSLRTLPVIALTAGALASERQRALDAGMDEFISKPFDPEALIGSVRAHITRKHVASGVAHTTGVPPSAAWPLIDGIDIEDSRERLSDDLGFFVELLRRAAPEFERLRIGLTQPGGLTDPQSIEAEVHRLKGVAGNVGARDLMRAAQMAEDGLRSGQRFVIEAALKRLLEELARVQVSIDNALATWPHPAQVVATDESSALDAATWADFLDALRQQDLSALTTFTVLSGALSHRLGSDGYDRLRIALDHLDFKRALELTASVVAVETRTGSAWY